MPFWTTKESEPRRNFKFIVSLGNIASEEGGIPGWVVKNVTLPKVTVGESTTHYLNHRFNYPGLVTYNDVSFTVVEAVNPASSKILFTALQGSGYQLPSELSAAGVPINRAAAVSSLGEITITHLGGEDTADAAGANNSAIYTLKNAWIKDIEWPQLAYDNEDVSEVKVVLKYDYFELT